MGKQVYFLGLDITAKEVRVTLLRRDGVVTSYARRELVPEKEDEEFCVYRPHPWARQISETAREVVEVSGIPAARIWGYAPVAPAGWICLDVEWQPMSDLFLYKKDSPKDISRHVAEFLAADQRRLSRVGLIAAPKDFLRFHWSKVIATDVTDAASFGLLSSRAVDWDPDLLFEKDLDADWLPPVLPSAFACGRVGLGGMEAMGLSSSAWAVVGSAPIVARMAACGQLAKRALYVFAHRPNEGYWYEERSEIEEPLVRSAPLDELPPEVASQDVPIVVDWLEGEDPEQIIAWAKSTGKAVYKAPFAGTVSPGAAVLAALASNIYPNRKSFYRRFPKPKPLEEGQ